MHLNGLLASHTRTTPNMEHVDRNTGDSGAAAGDARLGALVAIRLWKSKSVGH